MKKILTILVILILTCCNNPIINIGESKEAKELQKQNDILLLLLTLVLNSNSPQLTFPNYKYSFSAERKEIVNGNEEDVCVDILILRNRDPDKVVTGFESGRINNRCIKNEDVDFLCMTDLTFYVGIHYFKKSENTFAEKRDFCRDELKGIFIL